MADFNKIANISTSALSGLSSIIGSSMNSASINDVSMQEDEINSISDIGGSGYSSFDQITDAYNSIDMIQPDLSFDTIRGGSTGERIGNVLSSVASGASAGMVGTPWGALAGAVVGLGAGIGGWLAGDAKAETERNRLNNDLSVARYKAGLNLESRANNLQNKQFRGEMINSSANGGKITRQKSLSEFADSVLNKHRTKSYNPNNTIIREMCKGGVRIRIKK